MPSERSARVTEKNRQRNTPLRSVAKTYISRTQKLIAAKDLSSAEDAAKRAVVALDKAAQKGAIHPKNAGRRKSRLMKRLNAAKSSQ